MKTLFTALTLSTLLLSACKPQQTNSRGSEKSEGQPIQQAELNKASGQSQSVDGNLIALLQQAGTILKTAYASDNNVFAAGASYSVRDGMKLQRCVKVQIQERKDGKVVSKQSLTPKNQPSPCTVQAKTGLGIASLGFIDKIAGNNYIGGVGIGAVAYDGTYIVGCAAGAVGFASYDLGAADGTAGSFCTQVVNTN